MNRSALWLLPLGALAIAGCDSKGNEVGTAGSNYIPAPADVPAGQETPPPTTPAPTPTPSGDPGGPDAQGVDVSEYQGAVNWTQVKASGRTFAFIRVSDGLTHLDTEFQNNWTNAKAAGLVVGVYQFFRASEDPTQQANLLLSKMGPYSRSLIPPVADVEVMDGVSAGTLLAHLATWESVVKAAIGREPIVYCSPGFWNGLGAPAQASSLWLADWTTSSTPLIPNSWQGEYFWQYSDAGTVSGISGAVDIDRYHGDFYQLGQFLSVGQ